MEAADSFLVISQMTINNQRRVEQQTFWMQVFFKHDFIVTCVMNFSRKTIVLQ